MQLHELSTKVSSALRREQPNEVDASSHSRLVEDILRFRKQRNKAFGGDLFGEPAWDILLELYTARRTDRRLSVSGACYASGVPLTTALRWISRLQRDGWITRIDDPHDKRRCWLDLSEEAETKMRDLLSRMGEAFP
jgi:DNA-binding MarR family transcriptional regulator